MAQGEIRIKLDYLASTYGIDRLGEVRIDRDILARPGVKLTGQRILVLVPAVDVVPEVPKTPAELDIMEFDLGGEG
jgi:hypothetical protein